MEKAKEKKGDVRTISSVIGSQPILCCYNNLKWKFMKENKFILAPVSVGQKIPNQAAVPGKGNMIQLIWGGGRKGKHENMRSQILRGALIPWQVILETTDLDP